jgi:hypothetical protein
MNTVWWFISGVLILLAVVQAANIIYDRHKHGNWFWEDKS